MKITNLCYISGPVLPKTMSAIRMVPIGNQVVVSGGYDGTYQNAIYKLGCVYPGCTWQGMTTLQLSVARNYHVAVAVPNNFVNCPSPGLAKLLIFCLPLFQVSFIVKEWGKSPFFDFSDFIFLSGISVIYQALR